MCLRRPLMLLGLLALLLVPSAQGVTFPTRWHELRYQRKLLMTFNTKAITINGLPAFPEVLAPGQVWRGTFRGRGIPRGPI